MASSAQKNLQQGTPMQLTSTELVASTMPNAIGKNPTVAKPSAYFLPWQIFSLSLSRRTWLEKGPSLILPAMKTAQLLEKIMNAVGEGIYRAGNKKYFIICGTKDRPWGAIHIRNLLSQIKDASEKNWSTIPVPAGFDLKEAGGQVFEAQNAINYFLRIIAGIMHVNPSVLGLDTREARNVTEYPYFTHLRMKEQLMNQVRTQLIRLHIWAKYGEKLSKQGGYVDPQWIPKLRVKTEDLLNPADRLNLDIAILNAANPVMPQTKLEVERDIILTRGWEVDLPSQVDFMKDQKKQQDNQQKQDDADTKFKLENSKAQLEDLKNRNNPEYQQTASPQPSGNGIAQPPKTMGPPNPPSPDKQQKKLQNSTKKSNKPPKQPVRGTTRKPAEVQESLEDGEVQESLTDEEIQEPSLIEPEPQKIEPQKVDVNINVTTKSDPIKTEKQEVEVTIKQAEPKPQEPTKIDLTIKNEPVVVKAEKQEIEIKLKEDEEKKADEKVIREKKKKLLDEMSKQVNQEVESQ
jgi:hypothetical protein